MRPSICSGSLRPAKAARLGRLVAGFALVVGCSETIADPAVAPSPTTTPVWTVQGSDGLASSSSVRALIIDDDDVLDLVMGVGIPGDDTTGQGAGGAVVALSGADGSELWRAEVGQDVFGSATLVDLDADGESELVLGGRGSALVALEPSDGAELWRWQVPEGEPGTPGTLQFFTVREVPDRDGDGVADLVAANGGFPAAVAGEPRPPGALMLLSGASGEAIAAALMPDGAETYLSPVILDVGAEPHVVFGSGGETLPGSLWRAALTELEAGDLSGALELSAPVDGKGYIAPPLVADLDSDGQDDVLAAAFGGRLVALDGGSGAELWRLDVPAAESFATPALLARDGRPPLAWGAFALGAFDAYTGSAHRLVDAKTGDLEVSWEDARTAYSSPIAADLDGDGDEEGLIVLVGGDASLVAPSQSLLVVVDAEADATVDLAAISGFAAPTPWAGDLDGDARLDVVLGASVLSEGGAGWTLARAELEVPTPESLPWAAYLGSDYDGHWRP